MAPGWSEGLHGDIPQNLGTKVSVTEGTPCFHGLGCWASLPHAFPFTFLELRFLEAGKAGVGAERLNAAAGRGEV